jgi:hypothetical protein
MESAPLLTSAARVAAVRAEMRRAGVELFIVRGTDRYLNEYVPRAESSREWVTGFTGSTGDALIGLDAAWLFVDGRYHVQADREIDAGVWTVVKSAFGVTNERALGENLRTRDIPRIKRRTSVGMQFVRVRVRRRSELAIFGRCRVVVNGINLAEDRRSRNRGASSKG